MSKAIARSGMEGHLRTLVTAACLGVLLLAAGCARIVPYRTQATSASPIDCTPQVVSDSGKQDAVDSQCDRLIAEHAAGRRDVGLGPYDLNFIEFDDQGLPFPAIPQFGDASRQIDLTLDSLRQSPLEQPTSIVVFVHGWKHTAQSSDENVRWFRILLGQLSAIEAQSTCRMKVVGAYVGWRGAGTRFDPTNLIGDGIESTTFWSRKNAADRVAKGSIRELFGRLRSFQDARNVAWKKEVENAINDPDYISEIGGDHCTKKVRLTIVGHSFGGLIVYSALSPSLVRDMTDLKENIRRRKDEGLQHDPPFSREGDVVIAINPAVEAAVFAPLHRIAFDEKDGSERVGSYHSPVFVSITSTNDKATGKAFPIARFFSTLFHRYPKGAGVERVAARQTIGHDADYVDYDLTYDQQKLKATSYLTLSPVEDGGWITQKIVREKDGSQALDWGDLDVFVRKVRRASGDANTAGVYPRVMSAWKTEGHGGEFRNALILTPRNKALNVNVPVWNVSTGKPIVDGHSDLGNPLLKRFLLQLYGEGVRPEIARMVSIPEGP
ncbi:hypothetical protein [Luteibacter sp. SG786]|uniref:hypothetical protein n=1 Tax=Luteibacter sp. SG786 TaxID=2587130 RepID=UPI0014203944|nr:hypothetical protein [Luteibacter sp. SG786]NII55390.1 hypothetical protein [Luteibacter sp. SG786]